MNRRAAALVVQGQIRAAVRSKLGDQRENMREQFKAMREQGKQMLESFRHDPFTPDPNAES